MKILFLTLLVSWSSYAQITTPPIEPLTASQLAACPVSPPCPELTEKRSSATNRQDSFGTFMGGFQFLDTWVPAKLTASYTQILSRNFSLELEFATSERNIDILGRDIGTLTEERWALLLKYYVGTSFYINLGPYINELTLDIGDDIVNASGNRINDKASLSLVGVSFGIGNRWQFNNGFTLGVDWFRINQPTGTYKVSERIVKDLDADDADDVKETNKLFRNIPSFTFFGVNIGYTF